MATKPTLSAGRKTQRLRLSEVADSVSASAPTLSPTRTRSTPPRAFHREPYPATPVHTKFTSNDTLAPPVSQPAKTTPIPQPTSQAFWLSLYFVFNLGLTLYNKGVLLSFPFPYTLTAIHALFGSLGGTVLLRKGWFILPCLSLAEKSCILAFSALYTVNIIVSNASLGLVTVPFHQVVRAATPIFTIMFSAALFGKHSSLAKRVSLIPVVLGVGFATYGDYYCTLWGFWLTLLGTVLAALKTIFTNVLQSAKTTSSPPWRPRLSALSLLYLLSPLAFIQCVVLAWSTGELASVRQFGADEMNVGRALALAVNGCIAFGLNVVSFTANRHVGPLGMTVAANIKQVLTMLLAVVIFDLSISWTNGVGILLTLVGGALYARVEYTEKHRNNS
ncbi:TPT-domain-containing protein [Cylindrobasidium torrendii FP15055 ss-10]|uniref:TPT-domain-containing protein n=1 Tax=Cylindrobasidium torrendii FP15055 ss-10 TaxID=1314674 RepID=A0A0D7BBA8_9AGAR|nr:TPT-domain-containing protein [Cylindrobasidium torrendii FP15055 ss-10]